MLEKDVLHLTTEEMAQFDVVISAIGAFTPETFALHSDSVIHLATILKGTTTRLLIVGGAGSLYVDTNHQLQLKDTADFPTEYYPLADAMSKGLTLLRSFSDIAWTYMSPAADFDAEGNRTGHYQLGGEEFFVGASGESYISYADYALAMIDEVEQARHIRQRISVVG